MDDNILISTSQLSSPRTILKLFYRCHLCMFPKHYQAHLCLMKLQVYEISTNTGIRSDSKIQLSLQHILMETEETITNQQVGSCTFELEQKALNSKPGMI